MESAVTKSLEAEKEHQATANSEIAYPIVPLKCHFVKNRSVSLTLKERTAESNERIDIGRRQYPSTLAVHVKEILNDSSAIRFISRYLEDFLL